MALTHNTAEGPDELRKGREPALQCGGTGERWGAFRGGVAGLDAAAVGVADDDDVLDVEVFDGVGEHCGCAVVVRVELAKEYVGVRSMERRYKEQEGERGRDSLCDVAVDEDIARI